MSFCSLSSPSQRAEAPDAMMTVRVSIQSPSMLRRKGRVEKSVSGVVLRDTESDATETLPVQGFFVAIGHQPNTDLFKDVLDMDEHGYLRPHQHTMSSVPGVFIAGDVADHRYRQAVTAAGDGCRAAIDLERWLESQGEDVGVENWN